MPGLKEKLAAEIPALRAEVHQLLKDHGSAVISEVTVAQAFGGMRGVKGLVCDTSVVDPEKGVIIRGMPVAELVGRLPEEVFHLMVTGELPDGELLASLQNDLSRRAHVPEYIWDVLRAMPRDSHPMAMFAAAILVMERESEFRRRYAEGIPKDEFWVPTLEDSLQLLAKLPAIAAGIYRLRFRKGEPILSESTLDWGADYARMLGLLEEMPIQARIVIPRAPLAEFISHE